MAKIQKPKSRKGAPPPRSATANNLDKSEADAPLNFKVAPAFKVEFKTFAASKNMSMRSVLEEAFEALRKEQRG